MIMVMILLIVYGLPVEGLSVEGLSCEMLDRLVEGQFSAFSAYSKGCQDCFSHAAASEAICERLSQRTKHIGTTDRMARLLDDTFETLVMAQ
jgi:hypothetical protein